MMNCLIIKIQSISGSVVFFAGIICRHLMPAAMTVTLFFNGPNIYASQEISASSGSEVTNGMRMTRAVICEEIKDGQPVNEGIIFSSDLGKITCFTEFDSITGKTTIYHCWYFKDNLRAKKKPLILNPPKWSTFSQIEPRETDKGPWRVEIVDGAGNILQTLRFSITD
jgi:hypothetical protein